MPTTEQNPSVVLTDLSFAWPDGTTAVDRVTAAFGSGRTGLTGANGAGKTTLLRLIAGELAPISGAVAIRGTVGRLPQHLTLETGATVSDLVGIRERLDALRAIESGDTDPDHFDVLGDAWDVEARARSALDRIGLSHLGLDRTVGALSGGETVLTALAGILVHGDDVVLLDEPTNNLDRPARHLLYDAIDAWRGALIVVSHDATLLDLMDHTAELRSGSLAVFGGNLTAYRRHLDREQAAADQAVRTAEQNAKKEERQRVEAQTKLARRRRYARTDFENKRRPKTIMQQRKREAQVSAGRLRTEVDRKVDAARRLVREETARLRHDPRIRIDLPDPETPAGRRLAELRDGHDRTTVVAGRERVALTGRNGVGKTRLLERLIRGSHSTRDEPSAVAFTGRIGYLPQRLDHLDDDLSIVDTVRTTAPRMPHERILAGLARFLLRGDDVHRAVADLSGGERFRVALATLLLADPANRLLVLDEPTNSLDLDTVDELVSALDSYRGALIVVSHDDAFLARLRIDTWMSLDATGKE